MEERNCIIVHGCSSAKEREKHPETRTYDKHWIPWIQKQLMAHGIPTHVPLMPTPWKPEYSAFKSTFEKFSVTEKTILIGHSCGCAFLVKWLGETKQKIDTLILVAPWKIPSEHDPIRISFYTYPIDPTIASRVKTIVYFTADDEEDQGKESLELFREALGGKVILLKGRGHYTFADMGTEEFPELLQAIL